MRARASAVVIVSDKCHGALCAVSGVDCDSEKASDRPTGRGGKEGGGHSMMRNEYPDVAGNKDRRRRAREIGGGGEIREAM